MFCKWKSPLERMLKISIYSPIYESRGIISKKLPLSQRYSNNSRYYLKQWRKALSVNGESYFKSFNLPRDKNHLTSLKQALVNFKGNSGDFIPNIAITGVCNAYITLDFDCRRDFMLILAKELQMDIVEVHKRVEHFRDISHETKNNVLEINWNDERAEEYLRSTRMLRQSLIPLHESLFKQIIAQTDNGLLFLIKLRSDLIRIIRKEKSKDLIALNNMDEILKDMLSSWFHISFLILRRITFENSTGSLLEKIIRYEAVHPVDTIFELKRRLGPGRRCYCFFHPSVPEEPLVFIHVALVRDLAPSLDYLNQESQNENIEIDARAAIFYSISSTQPGLQGIDLGNFLIKKVAKELANEKPDLTVFSTLSPIPGFLEWIQNKLVRSKNINSYIFKSNELDTIFNVCNLLDIKCDRNEAVFLEIMKVEWYSNKKALELLEPVLIRVAARYLFLEKRRGRAMCPVANFHIRNGATMERLNWQADMSKRGLSQSAGIMVNYKYELENVERNKEEYVMSGTIPISKEIQELICQ